MRAENIKSSCLSIAAAIRCIKSAMSVKGIPTDVYIKTTQQLREIERENQRIPKAVWRKKEEATADENHTKRNRND